MPVKRVNRVQTTIAQNDHPYRNGAWTPNYDEFDATDMKVIGEIPRDIDGVYLRNTENPVHEAIGRYHPFDGDGMLHMISLADATLETAGGRNVEETYYYRGHANTFLGNITQAISDMERALELNPNFYPAQIALDSLRG